MSENAKSVGTFIVNNEDIVSTFAMLRSRWADERKYENIADYQRVLQLVMPKNVKVLGACKRPFGFHVQIEQSTFFLHASRRHTLVLVAR